MTPPEKADTLTPTPRPPADSSWSPMTSGPAVIATTHTSSEPGSCQCVPAGSIAVPANVTSFQT
jgi:hypothetical protein